MTFLGALAQTQPPCREVRRTLHGVHEGGQWLRQRRVQHVLQIAHWKALQEPTLNADEMTSRLKSELEGCGGKGFALGGRDQVRFPDELATLEATQWQILSQSPTDATRFWWHLYGT